MAALELSLPSSIRAVAATPAAWQNAVDAAVRLLRGPRSLWPVDTGRSKRAWRRLGSGLQSIIYNPLSYASYVEGRNGRPAERTLRNNVGTIRRAARETLTATRQEIQVEGRLGVLTAAAARERLEQGADLYSLFAANRNLRGRAPRIPRRIRDLEARLRRRASRGI